MVGKPEVLRVSLFLNPERAQDVQPKFAYEIVATSNCRLRQNVVCAALPNGTANSFHPLVVLEGHLCEMQLKSSRN